MPYRKCQLIHAFIFAILSVSTPLLAKSMAEGSVRLDKANWTVADAFAYPDDEEIEVVFSDKAFDRVEMASDGKFDTFDSMRHDGNTLTLNFDADGPTMCLNVSTRTDEGSYSGSSCNSEYQPTIKVTARTADRIAGSMQWGEKSEQHVHLTFDVPIEGAASGGAVARPGKPLPADGGAPGKAMLAHFAAVTAGDWNKLKALSHPERRDMMEASEKAGEHKQMFDFLQKFVPKKIKVLGGMLNGHQAQVDYAAEEEGRPVKGTADVIEFEGKWYFMGTTTHD
ncbi:MAG: hypothetical protein SGI99_07990 [Pseudomonadota bacterium]|mgnify:CR=1 FL=1|nr:hypothetical protein [Pseudomonadota bacterium]